MKKLFYLGALFAAGLGFAACSDKDDVGNDVAQNTDNGGGQYIAIGINLPQTPANMVRATDNGGNIDDLNDGLASEYAVNDAYVLIFDSNDKFKSAYSLDTRPWTSSTDPNVTQYSTKVVQKVNSDVVGIVNNVVGDQMLVILNANGVITNCATDGTADEAITIGSTSITTENTFADVAAATVTTSALLQVPGEGELNANGFFMTNAPLSQKVGSVDTYSETPTASDVRILVPITTTYQTEAAAYAATAVDQIYVERAVAKVTFDNTLPTGENATKMTASQLNTGANTTLTWAPYSWTLDNTNKTSYVVRSTEDDTNSSFFNLKSNAANSIYRFIGNQAITQGSPTFMYRTYFAKDPNYDVVATFNRVVAASAAQGTEGEAGYVPAVAATEFSTKFNDDNPQYCFENTFNVANQNVSQTTLVQVAIQAKNDGTAKDLYTLGKNKTVVYTQGTLKTFIQSTAFDYLKAKDAFTGDFGSLASTNITVSLTLGDDTPGKDNVSTLEITETFYNLLKDAYRTTDGSKYYLSATTEDSKVNVVSEVEALLGDIYKYENGISYYNIRIKHFGDQLTPWNGVSAQEWAEANAATAKPGGSNGIYPLVGGDDAAKKLYQANNYLGRYGVLRNNWYVLNVTKVRMLGDATPKTADWPDTPDDELDNYITFQINILSWAKHTTQSAEL